MRRPDDVFDRTAEWNELVEFVGGEQPIRLGIVYGRRRQGKSWLLRRLVREAGGIYTMALQHDRRSALGRMAETLGEASDLGGVRFDLDDWEEALGTARSVLEKRGERVLVLDEFPYLLEHSSELSSVLQAFYDDVRNEVDGPPLRILLCGSAISVMEELLSGQSPLRGRTQLQMRLQPFDFRTAARFWGVGDPDLAFNLDAILGGTPGYRDLVPSEPPPEVTALPEWLAETVLNPSSALFTEDDFLLREDPRIRDRAIYYSILQAVSEGNRTRTEIAGAVGRKRTNLEHPLDVLETAGFLTIARDIRKKRGSSIRIADPIVRFHQLITKPRLSQFEERQFEAAWSAARPTYQSQILGPHFEELAREWVRRFADDSTLGGATGEVGYTVVADPEHRKNREIDIVGLAAGERRHDKSSRISCIGEAKSSRSPRGSEDLRRLERMRELLESDGAPCSNATLLLFGHAGFEPGLEEEAGERDDVELVDLDRLYRGE